MRPKFTIVAILSIIVIMACQLATIASDTPTPDLSPQETDTAATATMAQQATIQAAEQTANAQAALDTQATQSAQSTADAAATATQEALDAQATAAQAQIAKQTATAQVLFQATQQAQPLYDWIQKLADQGEIASTQGTYYQLEDFEQSVAKINYFNWWSTGHYAENFAILTDIAWDVASDKANWFNTGCGFVFADNDDDNFHFMKLSLDGMATLRSYRQGDWKWIIQKRWGKPSIPSGQANVLMVVQNKRVNLYVDEQPVISANAALLRPGQINLSLSSGINTGFGTRCTFTNIGLWLFDE